MELALSVSRPDADVRLFRRFGMGYGVLFVAHVFVVMHNTDAWLPWSCVVIGLVEWLTVAALVWRACHTPFPDALRWWFVAGAMLFISVANLIYLLRVIGVGQDNPAPGVPMFFYALYGVAMVLAISMTFRQRSLTLVSSIDALMALVMAVLFFVRIFTLVTAAGSDDPKHVQFIIWLMDALSIFITLCAITRLVGAADPVLKHIFFAISFYGVVSTLVAAVRNRLVLHYQMLYLELPLLAAPIVLGLLCLYPPPRWIRDYRPRPGMVDVAESMSPFFLGLGLTALSVSLWTTRPGLAATGVAVAILGYGIRNVITQSQRMGTERQLLSLQGELENLVVTDPLTGIANRRGFDQQLFALWNRVRHGGMSLSILMIDIDHFKHFNDNHGHVIGDNCLRAVATGLAELLGPHHGVFARYGGEEFAVLLPTTTLAQATTVAESVRKAVEGVRVDSPDGPLGVTISIGVACSSQTPAENGKALLVFADTALLEAKVQGRNRVMVYR